jgi:hypothetical protein
MPRPVQHVTPYTRPGVVFRIHPDRKDRFAGAIGTVLNQNGQIQVGRLPGVAPSPPARRCNRLSYCWLSDAFPGFYFGFIGPDNEGWLQYGWIPVGQPQYGCE